MKVVYKYTLSTGNSSIFLLNDLLVTFDNERKREHESKRCVYVADLSEKSRNELSIAKEEIVSESFQRREKTTAAACYFSTFAKRKRKINFKRRRAFLTSTHMRIGAQRWCSDNRTDSVLDCERSSKLNAFWFSLPPIFISFS